MRSSGRVRPTGGRALVLRRALWTVVVLCAPAIFLAWRSGFPGREHAEVAVKLILTLLALALVSLDLLGRNRSQKGDRPGALLIVASVLAALAYPNFGRFHGRGFVHHWEQFHYTLNAKYFPELGHDGLYAASLEAQLGQLRASTAASRLPTHVRDLRTNEVVLSSSPEAIAHRTEVRARFSPERWRAFVRDNAHFLASNSPDYLAKIRKDHGFNPPPSWTFVARLFAGSAALDLDKLILLGCLDVVLLAALFVMIFKTYGGRIGCLALMLFGLNYAGRFHWVGGAFLREDWLVAVGIGICMLHRERFAIAGALIGYAAMVRLFPVLFLFGPAVVALGQAVRGEDWRWARRLALGFSLAAASLIVLGCLAGRGAGAWSEFAETIGLHRATWLTNNVGLENLLLYGPDDFLRVRVDFDLPEPWIEWQAHMNELKSERAWWVWLARLTFLGLLSLACWRARPAEAAILSLGCVFAMVLTTCYYWQALPLLVLLGSMRVVYGLLALNVGLSILHFTSGAFELRYGLMSWALLLLFVALYLPRARRSRQASASATPSRCDGSSSRSCRK